MSKKVSSEFFWDECTNIFFRSEQKISGASKNLIGPGHPRPLHATDSASKFIWLFDPVFWNKPLPGLSHCVIFSSHENKLFLMTQIASENVHDENLIEK